MSETKFTKGEWVAHVRGCYLNQGYASVETDKERIYGESMYNTNEIEATADAHLIAAAPEMYAMLEDLSMGQEYYSKDAINKLLSKARGETK